MWFCGLGDRGDRGEWKVFISSQYIPKRRRQISVRWDPDGSTPAARGGDLFLFQANAA